LAAISLNNFLKSDEYRARQRCEVGAGGEFRQLLPVCMRPGSLIIEELRYVQTDRSRALTDCGFENASAARTVST
jgi:hypothetical protein